MATSLDMSLDDMINKNRSSRGRGRGRSQGGGRGRGDGQREDLTGFSEITLRTSTSPLSISWQNYVGLSFNKTKDIVWRQDLFEDSMVAAGLSGIESSTKLYISNLHYGVTKEDIQELFSEMGHLKHCAVHYDNNRRPTGSAEVIFTRRSEAVAALKRYNNVRLDGKAMKIEVIGADLGLAAPSAPRISVVPGSRGRGQREVEMPGGSGFGRGAAGSSNFIPGWKRNNFSQRGGQVRGRGRGRNSFGRGRGRGHGYGRNGPAEKSAEQLDKELDNYHSGAMNVD
uniref:RRM domain-containing protein n=1 Tax=Leersia perrieri TaxID=77586 RepID=A0A0D9WP02_9ORYZ